MLTARIHGPFAELADFRRIEGFDEGLGLVELNRRYYGLRCGGGGGACCARGAAQATSVTAMAAQGMR